MSLNMSCVSDVVYCKANKQQNLTVVSMDPQTYSSFTHKIHILTTKISLLMAPWSMGYLVERSK